VPSSFAIENSEIPINSTEKIPVNSTATLNYEDLWGQNRERANRIGMETQAYKNIQDYVPL